MIAQMKVIIILKVLVYNVKHIVRLVIMESIVLFAKINIFNMEIIVFVK